MSGPYPKFLSVKFTDYTATVFTSEFLELQQCGTRHLLKILAHHHLDFLETQHPLLAGYGMHQELQTKSAMEQVVQRTKEQEVQPTHEVMGTLELPRHRSYSRSRR
jgi:hypothetical protein